MTLRLSLFSLPLVPQVLCLNSLSHFLRPPFMCFVWLWTSEFTIVMNPVFHMNRLGVIAPRSGYDGCGSLAGRQSR